MTRAEFIQKWVLGWTLQSSTARRTKEQSKELVQRLVEEAEFTADQIDDSRGCLWVCHEHSVWRERTSHAGGHGKDCPGGFPAGSGPASFHKAGRGRA